jgi:hypothetical protein
VTSPEIESEWYNISFNFKVVGTELDMSEQPSTGLLRGLAQAVAYLLLPVEDYSGIQVYASGLSVTDGTPFTDAFLDSALSQWEKDDKSNPE